MIYLPEFLSTFPNLKEIQLSSNFSLENSAQLINTLCQEIEQYNKLFTIKLQISVDGPKEINDFNKGIDITNKTIYQVNQLKMNYNNVNLIVTTNSILQYKGLYYFTSYEKIEEWFNFFLINFPNNIKHGLFRVNKTPIHLIGTNRNSENPWTKEDGLRYAQVLNWVDTWRSNNPTLINRFIWPIYKINILQICAVTQPNNIISLSPSGEIKFCHRDIYEEPPQVKDLSNINLTNVYDYLTDQYYLYKDKISLNDFKDSMLIYINLNWCPYLWTLSNRKIDMEWFTNEIPLLYNGAMNILLKWSKENG